MVSEFVSGLDTVLTGLSWLDCFLTFSLDEWWAHQEFHPLDFFQAFFISIVSIGLSNFFSYVMARGRGLGSQRKGLAAYCQLLGYAFAPLVVWLIGPIFTWRWPDWDWLRTLLGIPLTWLFFSLRLRIVEIGGIVG